MLKLNVSVRLLCLACVLFVFSACETGDRPADRTWDYTQSAEQESAQKAPKPLSDIYHGEARESAALRTGVDLNAVSPSAAIQQEPLQDTGENLQTVRPVRVALLLPLSGNHKALGKAMLHAAQIALFDTGYDQFEIIPRDTESTPEGAREAARDSVKEHVDLVLGPVFAESVRAVKPVIQRAGINMISFSTDWELAGRNTFIMGFLPFDQIERVAQYAAAKNLTQIGIIAPRTPYGQAVISTLNAIAPRYGIHTADILQFAPRSSNLSPELRHFTRYDIRTAPDQTAPAPLPFDAVLMPVGGIQARSIANLLSYYDMPPKKVRRLGTGLFDDPGLASEANLDGAWFAAPSPRLRKSFESRFLSTYGYPAPRLASLAYDATALAAILARRGLQRNGRPAFDKASITNPNGFAGIDGIFRFRPDGTAERGLAILSYKRGKIVVLEEAPQTFVEPARY